MGSFSQPAYRQPKLILERVKDVNRFQVRYYARGRVCDYCVHLPECYGEKGDKLPWNTGCERFELDVTSVACTGNCRACLLHKLGVCRGYTWVKL